jgi:hypothetical protein
MTGGPDDVRPYYGRARIAAGLMLIGLVIVLALIDALSFDYSVDSIQLGLLLGTGLVLLGVEAGRKLLGGG